jgi:hypothetical protein
MSGVIDVDSLTIPMETNIWVMNIQKMPP